MTSPDQALLDLAAQAPHRDRLLGLAGAAGTGHRRDPGRRARRPGGRGGHAGAGRRGPRGRRAARVAPGAAADGGRPDRVDAVGARARHRRGVGRRADRARGRQHPRGAARRPLGRRRARSTAGWSAGRRSSCRATCRRAGTSCTPTPRRAPGPPPPCWSPRPRCRCPAALEHDRVWGVMTQLYQVRSAGSWGLGDLADLATLARWAAGEGADFVLVNPLHAAEPVAPVEASPYLPTTRRFANPSYLRIEDTDEYAALAGAGPRPDRPDRRRRPAAQHRGRPRPRHRLGVQAGGAGVALRGRRPRPGVHHLAGRARDRVSTGSRPGARSPRSTACRGEDWPAGSRGGRAGRGGRSSPPSTTTG